MFGNLLWDQGFFLFIFYVYITYNNGFMYSSIFVVAIKQYANTVDVRNKTSRNSYGIITIVLLLYYCC